MLLLFSNLGSWKVPPRTTPGCSVSGQQRVGRKPCRARPTSLRDFATVHIPRHASRGPAGSRGKSSTTGTLSSGVVMPPSLSRSKPKHVAASLCRSRPASGVSLLRQMLLANRPRITSRRRSGLIECERLCDMRCQMVSAGVFIQLAIRKHGGSQVQGAGDIVWPARVALVLRIATRTHPGPGPGVEANKNTNVWRRRGH